MAATIESNSDKEYYKATLDTVDELEKAIGSNMGCYYRVKTNQWLQEINDPHTKEYSHLSDMTANVKGTVKYVQRLLLSRAIEELEGLDELSDGQTVNLNPAHDNYILKVSAVQKRIAELTKQKDNL